MGKNKLGPEPLTPFTGGEENSSIGLFAIDTKEDGTIPGIVVCLTGETIAEQVRNNVETFKEAHESGNLGLLWNIAINSDGPTEEESSTVRASAIQLKIAVNEDDEDVTRENLGKKNIEVLLDVQSLLPLNVVEGWLQLLADEASVIEVSIVDAVTVVRTKKAIAHDKNWDALYTESLIQVTWNLNEQDWKSAQEEVKLLKSKIHEDIFFSELNYKALALKATTIEKEGD